MLENKKRANPFNELALKHARIQWRIWEKIQNITVISSSYGGGGGIRTHVRKPLARSSYMLIPVFGSRLIRRLGESSGISQPSFSHLPAPDGVGKTSLKFDVPSAAQASARRRASLN